MPYLQLGYNCSKQESTGYSPYHLLYARDPYFPSGALMQTLDKKLCFDKVTEEEAARSLAARSKIIKTITPIIANRLAVVQQRDKLR